MEKLWNFETVTHGEAVGIGMVMISRVGEKLGLTQQGTANRIINVLEKNNMKISDIHSVSEIVDAMSADKKRTGSVMKFVMLSKIGSSFIYPVNNDDIAGIFGV